MLRVSSFMYAGFSEGSRIMYTLTELDEKGNAIKDQIKGNFFVLDEEMQAHINAINDFILKRLEE